MIYVDDIREYPQGKYCHMWTDSDDATLDAFATRLGLKRSWSHTSRGAIIRRFYHYDLVPSKRAKALQNGAIYMPLKDYIKIIQETAK